ncbi:MAG: hypothetical protein ACI8RZ_005390 [Myxococcota bacterium]|jgi:hypothetical protein
MLLLLAACARPDVSPPADAPGLLLESVTWRQTWETAGITRSAEEWSTTTDLGYTVTITAGQLVTYNLGLLPCPEASAGWGLLGTAHAAHGPSINATSLTAPQALDLLALSDATLDTCTFPPARYCSAEALIARADQHTRGVGGVTPVAGVSLALTGHWQRGEVRQPFDMTTTLSTSSRADLDALAPGADALHAEVTLSLSPARMFDGIPLAEESEARILRAVLTNLLSSSDPRITLTTRDTP